VVAVGLLLTETSAQGRLLRAQKTTLSASLQVDLRAMGTMELLDFSYFSFNKKEDLPRRPAIAL